MKDDKKEVKPTGPKPKVFASAGFVKRLDHNTYGLFRSIEVETGEKGIDGRPIREKVNDVGPIRVLRQMEKGEEQIVVLRTADPDSGVEIALVEVI